MINIIKAGLKNILNKGSSNLDDLRFDIGFTSVLPENIKEIIEILSEATAGKPIMSQQTAMKNNPYIDDSEEEIMRIRQEQEQESILNLGESVV